MKEMLYETRYLKSSEDMKCEDHIFTWVWIVFIPDESCIVNVFLFILDQIMPVTAIFRNLFMNLLKVNFTSLDSTHIHITIWLSTLTTPTEMLHLPTYVSQT